MTGILFLSFCRYSRSKDNNILAKLMCQCYQINLRWAKNFIYIPPGAKICTLLYLVCYENFYLSNAMCYFYMLILFVLIANISMKMSPIFNFIRLHRFQIIVWICIHYLLFTAISIILFMKCIIVLCHRYLHNLDRVLLWYR